MLGWFLYFEIRFRFSSGSSELALITDKSSYFGIFNLATILEKKLMNMSGIPLMLPVSFWNIISIAKKHEHPFNWKILIKFSSFFMWMMLPKIFCQLWLSSTFEKIAWKLHLRRSFNAFSADTSLALELRVNSLLTVKSLG